MFGPPKSGSIPPIGSSGTPIFSGRDARHSDLPGGGAQRRGRSLEMVEISLFWVNLGHFVLDKGRVVDPIFFGRRLAAPPRWSAAFSRYTRVCVTFLHYRWWARPWPKSIETHFSVYVCNWLTDWKMSRDLQLELNVDCSNAFDGNDFFYMVWDIRGVVVYGLSAPFFD